VYEGRAKPVRFLKRAQIFVADLWACFENQSYGDFYDIDKITMFADYRIPQILISLGALYCSPAVSAAIKDKQLLESGGKWEMQLRGTLRAGKYQSGHADDEY
jgi:Potential Queuosine, Q, salvage protein family